MDKADRKSEFEQEEWAILKEQRKRASIFPLNILVWGPTDDGTPEYKARCKIRDELRKRGHYAEFSEDLCKSPEALQDPLRDEYLQAKSADAVIIIYRSRGTQTEVDKILTDSSIAQKTFLLIEEDIWSNVRGSVAWKSWEKIVKVAHVVRYKGQESVHAKIDEICDSMEVLRTERYVDKLIAYGQRF